MRDLTDDELENLINDNLKKSPDFEYATKIKYISDLTQDSFNINDIVNFVIDNFPGAKQVLSPRDHTSNKATYAQANKQALKKYLQRFLKKNFQLSKKENSNQLSYTINAEQLKDLYNNINFQTHIKKIIEEQQGQIYEFEINELSKRNAYVAKQLEDIFITPENNSLLQQQIFEYKKKKVIELLFDKYFDFDETAFLNSYKKDPTTNINNFVRTKDK